MSGLIELLEQDRTLVVVWLAILWLAVAYLVTLGVMVLAKPDFARAFLSGFAQSLWANFAEAGLRALAGLACIGASAQTKLPSLSVAVGLFLVVSAILMALLPKAHRRLAPRATAKVFAIFPLFGVLSLMLAGGLAWFIA